MQNLADLSQNTELNNENCKSEVHTKILDKIEEISDCKYSSNSTSKCDYDETPKDLDSFDIENYENELLEEYISGIIQKVCDELEIENDKNSLRKLKTPEVSQESDIINTNLQETGKYYEIKDNISENNDKPDQSKLDQSLSETADQNENLPKHDTKYNELSNNEQTNITASLPNDIDKEDSITDENLVAANVGLQNPRAYCYLNSVIQVLYNYRAFTFKMIEYYEKHKEKVSNSASDSIAYELGQLYYHMSNYKTEFLNDNLRHFQLYFNNSLAGDDIHKCYLQLLSGINLEIKVPREHVRTIEGLEENEAEMKFREFRDKNYGFMFDQFCGQISFQVKCISCQKVDDEKFQLFRSMPLQIPFSYENIPIEDCIRNFFVQSKIVGRTYSCCKDPNICSIPAITHAPKYMFIYLTRGSYNSLDNKNETFIDFQRQIIIPTIKGLVSYSVLSVIDHVGRNECGHYFAKTYSEKSWWLKNDTYVDKIRWNQVPTRNSIGLFLEMVACDGTIWNGINLKNQCGIHWIIQMLLSCTDFKENLLSTYKRFWETLKFQKEDLFVTKMAEIIQHFEEYEIGNVREMMAKLPAYFENELEINDIHTCYIQTLGNIFSAMSHLRKNQLRLKETSVREDELRDVERQSYEFEDLFSETICYQIVCTSCNNVFSENLQTRRSIPIQLSAGDMLLQDCIQHDLADSQIESPINCCGQSSYVIRKEIIRSPKYLFIYLSRGRQNSCVHFGPNIEIHGKKRSVSYKIRSVIDSDRNGKYLFKYYSGKSWWQSDGNETTDIPWDIVLARNCTGIFMEMENYKKNDLNDDLQVNSGLNSIVEMVYFCEGARKMLIDFHQKHEDSAEISEEMRFKKKLAVVMHLSQHGRTDMTRYKMKDLQSYLPDNPLNIEELYSRVLTNLHLKEEYSTLDSTNQNIECHGCDLFTGSISFQTKCANCENTISELLQPFQFIKLTFSGTERSIQDHIENYFHLQNVSDNVGDIECCDKKIIVSTRKLIRAPRYLLFYLPEETDCKDNFYLERKIVLPTLSGGASYSLLSLLNRVLTDDGLYYFIKVLDEYFKPQKDIENNDIHGKISFSENVIGFMVEFNESFIHSINPSTNLKQLGTDVETTGNDETFKDVSGGSSIFIDETNVHDHSQSSCEQPPHDPSNNLLNDVDVHEGGSYSMDDEEGHSNNKDEDINNTTGVDMDISPSNNDNHIINPTDIVNSDPNSLFPESNKAGNDETIKDVSGGSSIFIDEKNVHDHSQPSCEQPHHDPSNNLLNDVVVHEGGSYSMNDDEGHGNNKDEDINNTTGVDMGISPPNSDNHIIAPTDIVNADQNACLSEPNEDSTSMDTCGSTTIKVGDETIRSQSNYVINDEQSPGPYHNPLSSVVLVDKENISQIHVEGDNNMDVSLVCHNENEAVVISVLNNTSGISMDISEPNNDNRVIPLTDIVNSDPNDLLSEPNEGSTSMDTCETNNDILHKVDDEMLHKDNDSPDVILDKKATNFDGALDETVIMKSIEILFSTLGDDNCFSSIIAILFLCASLRDRMLEYHTNHRTDLLALKSLTELQKENIIFVNDVGLLFACMLEKDEMQIRDLLRTFNWQNFLGYEKFDLFHCFSSFLRRIDFVAKHSRKTCDQSLREADPRLLNSEFCDMFKGEMLTKTYCGHCSYIYTKEPREINGMNFTAKGVIHLEPFLKRYFAESEPFVGHGCCDICGNSTFKSIRSLTRAPEYLFIYLDRSYEELRPQYINCCCEDGIIIEVDGANLIYSLCAATEHRSFDPHQFQTQFFVDHWRTIHGKRVESCDRPQYLSGFKIGIMLKKV